jgi:hypothetical protein
VPSTIGGLLLFVVFLIPGFVYYIQRRRWVELKSESSLIETARLLSVSLLTNLCAVGVFAFVRHLWPAHTPNPESLLTGGSSYIDEQPGYLLLWAMALMVLSSILAFLLALVSKSRINIKWLSPDIVQTSAWNRYLGDKESIPDNTTPYVGIDMQDGTYVSGFVDWLSTELDEVQDRDLVLAKPITVQYAGGNRVQTTFPRLVVSARDIVRMFVTYLNYAEVVAADQDPKDNPDVVISSAGTDSTKPP